VGKSYREDRAALRVTESARCTIDGNTFENAFFGIYLAKSTDCRVTGNVLRASGTSSMTTANGIHLWASDRAVITGNEISGHRDGIYIEFSRELVVMNNRSERNHRYGLHFMFSDDCAYRDNTFTDNGAGVAVMYAARTEMTRNTFADNRGTAAYGLLLKDITDGLVEGNRFTRNTTALLADGTTRLDVIGNTFEQNGWAVRLDASTQESRLQGNAFSGNTFDLATNSSHTAAQISGNYWDRYAGYDLDRNGIGDVPHRPVRLFAVLAERFEPSMVLLRSFFVDLLDSAERLFPSLTPITLLDPSPAMRPPTGAAS
jgi:nitrous oxidase accessory protein